MRRTTQIVETGKDLQRLRRRRVLRLVDIGRFWPGRALSAEMVRRIEWRRVVKPEMARMYLHALSRASERLRA
jgi:hypothetical protein